MKTFPKLVVIGMVSFLPFAALAADAPKSDSSAKPAASELHGFDKYWSKMDPSGKGFITKDEFMAHQADRFKEIDTNGDGKITKDEMKAYDDKMYQHRQEMRQHHHDMMDKKDSGAK